MKYLRVTFGGSMIGHIICRHNFSPFTPLVADESQFCFEQFESALLLNRWHSALLLSIHLHFLQQVHFGCPSSANSIWVDCTTDFSMDAPASPRRLQAARYSTWTCETHEVNVLLAQVQQSRWSGSHQGYSRSVKGTISLSLECTF